MNKYSTEEKQQAIDLYFKNGCNMKKTVRELGYGSATGILRWLRETVPDKVSKPVQRKWKVDYPEEIKQAAVIDLCESNSSTADIAEKYGISRATLYEWKVQYIGKGNCILKQQKLNSKEYYINEINRLKEEKRLVEQELKKTQAELYRAHLEKDVYEKAAEILKKEMGNNLKEFSNQEKAMVIIALRDKYPVKRILEVFDMAKSSYCYQQKQIKKENKIVKIKERIKILFFENHKRYGYRRIHLLLKREGIIISEKIVRSIMKEENLIVRIIRQKKYSSYLGEISPAVPNEIQRDFHADKPNKKWLTDITEFKIGEGKVYLSPIIDCFDGMPITWTVGTSPNAELVNTMLDNAIVLLKENEHPIVHSDRGCHYRWSGWIQRMDEAGLTRSMSKKGCSPDNSACEGFFGRMKNEMFYGEKWDKISVEEFISIINQYMQWYRDKRIKLSLGGLSPMEYRRIQCLSPANGRPILPAFMDPDYNGNWDLEFDNVEGRCSVEKWILYDLLKRKWVRMELGDYSRQIVNTLYGNPLRRAWIELNYIYFYIVREIEAMSFKLFVTEAEWFFSKDEDMERQMKNVKLCDLRLSDMGNTTLGVTAPPYDEIAQEAFSVWELFK